MSYEKAIVATILWTFVVAHWWYAGIVTERRADVKARHGTRPIRSPEVLPPMKGE